MEIAAYNRGTQVIRRQADEQAQDARPAIDARHQREIDKETIASLQRQLDEAHAQQERERETYAAALAELSNASIEIEILTTQMAIRYEALSQCRIRRDHYRSKWQKLSDICRAGMTPEQFHAAELTATMHDA